MSKLNHKLFYSLYIFKEFSCRINVLFSLFMCTDSFAFEYAFCHYPYMGDLLWQNHTCFQRQELTLVKTCNTLIAYGLGSFLEYLGLEMVHILCVLLPHIGPTLTSIFNPLPNLNQNCVDAYCSLRHPTPFGPLLILCHHLGGCHLTFILDLLFFWKKFQPQFRWFDYSHWGINLSMSKTLYFVHPFIGLQTCFFAFPFLHLS